MTINEIKQKWYESNCSHTETELLRETVDFINSRAEFLNEGKSYMSLISDYLRHWNDNN